MTKPDVFTTAAERSRRYLDSLPTRPVAPDPEAVARLTKLDIPLQNYPIDPARVVEELDDIVSGATMAMAGPRFFGFVIGATHPAARHTANVPIS